MASSSGIHEKDVQGNRVVNESSGNKPENKPVLHKSQPTSTKLTIISQHPQECETNTPNLREQGDRATIPEQKGKVKSKQPISISLDQFLNVQTKVKKVKKPKHTDDVAEIYRGNPLDSSHPVRSVGKHREIPKKRTSKLKEDILKQVSNVCVTNTEVNYSDNLITDFINQLTAELLRKVVTFQQNAFKKDPSKARIKKRYIVGLHETKKYLLAKRIKFLIIACDLKIRNKEELLYKIVLELKSIAKENDIPYVFALKRSKIGNLTMKYRPVSCVGILSYQSAEDEVRNILDNLVRIDKNDDEDEEKSNKDYTFLSKLQEVFSECDTGSGEK